MTTYNKTYLPDEILHNNKVYVRATSIGFKINGEPLPSEKPVCVKVLSKNLKGRLDFHNHPYKPTVHYFVPKNITKDLVYGEYYYDSNYKNNRRYYGEKNGVYVFVSQDPSYLESLYTKEQVEKYITKK